MSTTGDEPQTPQPDGPAESISFAAPAGAYVDGAGAALPPAPKRSRRRLVVGGAALGVAVLAAGGLYVASALSGGGAQPDTVVPSTAVAYANLDLDPSAGQKVAAFRLLRKFPSSDRSSSEGDLVGQVVKSALKLDGSTTVDYDRDLAPWLGQRAAIAAVPAGGSVDTLVVVQVKDEGRARTTIRRLQAESAAADGTPQGVVVRNGYALIGPTQARTEAMSAAAADADLASSATYQQDMKRITAPGIASAWADLDALRRTVGNGVDGTAALGIVGGADSGRLVAGVRVDGDAVELAAHGFGATPAAGAGSAPSGPLVQKLPADTTAVLGIGDVNGALAEVTDSLSKSTNAGAAGTGTLADVESALGIKVPADLQTLLGSSLAVVVGNVQGPDPQIAVRVATEDPSGSQRVLDTLLASARKQLGGFVTLPTVARATSGDGVVYGSTQEYAATVARDGTLGQDPTFLATVPDSATASTVGYVSFGRVAAQVTDPEARKNLDVLRAAGLTVRTSGSDSDAVLRVVTR